MKRVALAVMAAVAVPVSAHAEHNRYDGFYFDVEYECKVQDGAGEKFKEKDEFYERALSGAFSECERKSLYGGCRAYECEIEGEVNPYPVEYPYPDSKIDYKCTTEDAAGEKYKDEDQYLDMARENSLRECAGESMVGGCMLKKCEIKGEFFPSVYP